MWKSIKDERRIVLDCPSDMVVDLINASSEFDMTNQYNVSKAEGGISPSQLWINLPTFEGRGGDKSLSTVD